ncbi:hypothetical protein SPHINGO391_350479 [Sphingomonas aurantiaca]|uniref:Uncharacterized protein n=1 Tax=Sphingomonas aurantiaca TaxID=185949 RepID=A0A5E7Y9I5_9SPHN|nr:hypothetical protein SPHINGO391_350479 [Sphingomonas aurantiaca]
MVRDAAFAIGLTNLKLLQMLLQDAAAWEGHRRTARRPRLSFDHLVARSSAHRAVGAAASRPPRRSS